MVFNANNQELYITLDDVLNETSFSSKDLQDKLGANFEDVLKRDLSRAVYRFLHGQYRGFKSSDHKDILNALIFNNRNYQYGLKLAMVEMVKGAMYSGMDLNTYSAEVDMTATGLKSKKSIPDTVYYELKNSGLLDLSGRLFIDEDTLAEIQATYPSIDTLLSV